MTLKVQVRWVNPRSPLFQDDLAKVELTGATSTGQSVGVREFEVPDGTTAVELKVELSAHFGAVTLPSGTTVAAGDYIVFRANQSYEVVNATELKPKADFSPSGGHPLVETTSASSANGATQILLRTEFVSLANVWKKYAADVDVYLAGHDKGSNLAILGYTGGTPLLWFASVPDTLQRKPPSSLVSCLVFYRPANDGYTKVDQAHSMSRLNRFLLAQVPGSTDFDKAEVFMKYPAPPGESPIYGYLRCGFERALLQSSKPVVMLHPWPNGLDYGDATGTKLPALAAWAVRYLWGTSAIDVFQEKDSIRLGRLGLSGFSAGGQAMWATLKTAGDRIEEVYSFDANGIDAAAAIQWFGQSPTTRCLRMTGAFQIASHQAIKQAIEKTSGATIRVTAWPSDPSAYDAGSTPVWDQALSILPNKPPKQMWQDAVRKENGYRHQLAVFGGSGAVSSGSYVSFLQEFLQGSDF